MKLFPAFLIISITLAFSSCGSKNENAAPSAPGDMRGVYVGKDGVYDTLDFRSVDHVMMYSSLDPANFELLSVMSGTGRGLTQAATYVRQGDYLYIKVPTEMLSLKVLSPTEIEGEGLLVKGTYIRK